jgi:hypothetical protein
MSILKILSINVSLLKSRIRDNGIAMRTCASRIMERPFPSNLAIIVAEFLIEHDGEVLVNEELKKYGPNRRMGFGSGSPRGCREELTEAAMTIGWGLACESRDIAPYGKDGSTRWPYLILFAGTQKEQPLKCTFSPGRARMK